MLQPPGNVGLLRRTAPRSSSPMNPAPAGFTLVELITVIAVLAILSVGTMRFLTDATSGYASTVNRAGLVEIGHGAMVDLTRGLRAALPGSVRVDASGDCLEFIPITAVSKYTRAPIGYAATTLRMLPLFSTRDPRGMRVAIAPDNPYQLAIDGPVSSPIVNSTRLASGEVQLSLAVPHQFPAAARSERLFLIEMPVSVCRDEDRLYRYQDYGIHAVQPGREALPDRLPERVLMIPGLSRDDTVFSYTGPTLQRNALVRVSLALQENGDTLHIQRSVHVASAL